jgi:hypothetical protein
LRRKILLACILAFACVLAAVGAAATRAADALPAAQESQATTTETAQSERTLAKARAVHDGAVHWLGGQIKGFQRSTWHWQRVMGRPLTQRDGLDLLSMSVPAVKQALARWHVRAHAARRAAAHPPHMRQWLCIHRYEGSWTDADGLYYGGLQMDWGFMSRYGGFLLRQKGPANRWTPLEQMWVAERAYRSGRGFWPWPSTARYCGLL